LTALQAQKPMKCLTTLAFLFFNWTIAKILDCPVKYRQDGCACCWPINTQQRQTPKRTRNAINKNKLSVYAEEQSTWGPFWWRGQLPCSRLSLYKYRSCL